jgi:hypothetical protein
VDSITAVGVCDPPAVLQKGWLCIDVSVGDSCCCVTCFVLYLLLIIRQKARIMPPRIPGALPIVGHALKLFSSRDWILDTHKRVCCCELRKFYSLCSCISSTEIILLLS